MSSYVYAARCISRRPSVLLLSFLTPFSCTEVFFKTCVAMKFVDDDDDDDPDVFHAAKRRLAPKCIRRLILSETGKIHSNILPTDPSINFIGVKKCEIWP